MKQTPLKTDPFKTAAFHQRGRGKFDRKPPARPDSDGQRWYVAMRGARACVACGGRGDARGLVLHHVVYRQHVRAKGGDEWDPRNALPLCGPCHSAHHARRRVLPIALLPAGALAFARELLGAAVENYLVRYYEGPATGARVDHQLGGKAYEC